MNSRHLVSVQKIIDIKPIDGADLIAAYKVNGWWVVDQVDKYHINDLILFAEIDSWIPTTIAPFLSKGKVPHEYYGVAGERLRTVRLKKQLSQGLLMPISILDSFDNKEWTEGDNVTDLLGIQKWEAPIIPQLAGVMKGYFPAFVSKTDQIRLQNIQQEITDAFNNKDEFEVTTKLDGSSCTIYFNQGEVGVCSRNVELLLDQEGNAFVDIAIKTGLLNTLNILGKNIAVQGELMGPGIQGNKENFKENKFFIFDIFDIDNQCYFPVSERLVIIKQLQEHGSIELDVVPLTHLTTLPSDNIDQLLTLAEGSSVNASVREGIVFKRIDGNFSFKIINNAFLINEK
jgi:RNA ligase (TIGR02306 family)